MKGSRFIIIILFLTLSPARLIAQEENEENPHLEMLKDEFVCLDCHTRLPKEDEPSPDYFLVDLPSENCLGCHSEVEHSGIKEHEGEASNPLSGDENGKIACFTCHDPHPAGAIAGRTVYQTKMNPRSRAFTRLVHIPGVETRVQKDLHYGKKRDVYLRAAIRNDEICLECHKTVNGKQWRKRILWDRFLRFFSYSFP
jgi:hypothetical protein